MKGSDTNHTFKTPPLRNGFIFGYKQDGIKKTDSTRETKDEEIEMMDWTPEFPEVVECNKPMDWTSEVVEYEPMDWTPEFSSVFEVY